MANPMGYSLDYRRDEPHDEDEQISHDPSLLNFANSYAFNPMLSQDGDMPLQSFDRTAPQSDLEGRLSNVMLTYDTDPSGGVSLPMNLDGVDAFAFEAPTTYPGTSMGLAPALEHSQLHSFSPFMQSMPQVTQASQYIQQPSALQPRKDTYNTGSNSSGSLEESDLLRASDRSQVPVQPIAQDQRFQQHIQPAPYRPPQPVAIQPKRPVVKGKYCAWHLDLAFACHRLTHFP